MKTLKMAKYQAYDLLSAVRVFYIIIISILFFLGVLATYNKGNVSSSGIDFATVIFIFVAGLNSFKSAFKFSQSNNISRITFFKGTILGALPITFGMAVLDIIINRIYNLFVSSPMNFDMIYRSIQYGKNFVPNNDFNTIIATLIFQFALYTMFFMIGLMVTTIYYRSNTVMKIIVSVSPFLLLIFLPKIAALFPRAFLKAIIDFLVFAFQNSYSTSITFLVLSIVFAGFAFLLCRRAVAKE